MTSPREVTERVHTWNKGSRGDDEEGVDDETWVRIRTFGLKDFFTRVNRLLFMEDLEKIRRKIREENPRFKFF